MEPFDLSGWGAIATHLAVSKKTARRYEIEQQLPIWRLRGGIRSNTRAIDEWIRKQSTSLYAQADTPIDFRRVFGNDPMIYLIYSELTLNRAVPTIIDAYERLLRKSRLRSEAVGNHAFRTVLKTRPLVTYDRNGNHGKDGNHFRAVNSACVCEVRAAAYLAAEFSRFPSLRWKVVGSAHSDVYGRADLSFVSFGTLINSKSQDIFTDPEALVRFEDGRFVSRRLEILNPRRASGLRFLHEPVHDSSKYDYGVVMKLHPTGNTVSDERVWLACAGVHQKGTSATAWVLAHWAEIARKLKKNTGIFAGLVRVPNDTEKGDDSASLLWLVETPEDLKDHESDT